MAVTISFYAKFVELFGDNSIDLDGDTFDIILMNSSHVFNSAHTDKSSISANEIATANGYVQGAKTLTAVTWGESGGTTTFTAADVTWTATGGSIGPATDAVVYSETSTNDKLVCSVDFDGAETAGDGTNFVITWNASGIFTIS